jgi:hypothetical protein
MARNKIFIQCPQCVAKCIDHRVFQSTRVADYANGRFQRYYRCGPPEKDKKHVEHEWMVNDIRPGTDTLYPELGDEDEFDENLKFGHPSWDKIKQLTPS